MRLRGKVALMTAHFPRPRDFVRRENARQHLAFGRGRHMCVGAPLARLVGRIGMQTLYVRLPGLHVVLGQELRYLPNLTVVTLTGLQVQCPAA